jgi:ceramide glucosyltransferase
MAARRTKVAWLVHTAGQICGAVLMGLSLCGALFAVLATWATGRFLRLPATRPSAWPSVTVLRPLHGDEPELYENLVSLCDQDYPGPVRIVLGVQDPADPALGAARRLHAEHPDRDIVLVVDPTPHGANRKIGNVINMSARITGQIIVLSDSDVRLPRDGLAAIVAALEAPGAGLVHCLYRGRAIDSRWSILATQDSNTRFIPSVVVGDALGAHPCLGPTMALTASVLDKVGGFAYLADFLADDFELGREVRRLGYRIVCPRIVIDHVFPERSARQMLVHELRWARTVRLVQPAGYLGSVITHFLALAMIGAVLAGGAGWSLALLAALLLVRLGQAHWANRTLRAEGRALWLIPVRDLISFAVFVAAHLGARVEWRGHRMVVRPDGAIAAP